MNFVAVFCLISRVQCTSRFVLWSRNSERMVEFEEKPIVEIVTLPNRKGNDVHEFQPMKVRNGHIFRIQDKIDYFAACIALIRIIKFSDIVKAKPADTNFTFFVPYMWS